MRKIKVLILVDKFDYHGSYINGPTRYFSWILQRFDNDRFEIHLCSLREKGRSDSVFKKENINVTYMGLGKCNILTFFYIVKMIINRNIDVLHLTGYASSIFGRIAGVICRKPSIIHEHWVDPNISRIQYLIEKFMSVFTERAIACSEYAARFLHDKKGMRSDKIVVIPNGIPLDKFRRTDRSLVRLEFQRYGISTDDLVVGIVGMLHENKGHQYFIQAARMAREKYPNMKFLIVGDGEIRNYLEEIVSENHLEKTVIFLGHQHDMVKIFNAIDILVSASISETAPLSIIEAMSTRKAIITTDCGGGSEIIQDNVTGMVVPVRNPEAIFDKIDYFMSNREEMERVSENAYLESRKYSIDKNVERIQNIYIDVYQERKKIDL